MSRSRASSSGGLIEGHGLGHDTIAEVGTQEGAGVQVHLPPQEGLELILHGDEAQADPAAGDKLDQQVDVALLPELAVSRRAE